ncbi:MarR family transcriptional regulator [Clostridium butyricum]|uniref:MarR family transcriptional regulator n=1 Tax=Clostridium butyricum TaxID=1492 RepID=UPI00374E9D03
MQTDILNQFSEFIEKQDVLCKLTESQKLHAYSYSEIGIIKAIGNLENPNVTEIANSLKITKGAISKNTKKLMSKGVIETYTIPNNKQKIFFKLTQIGETLFQEHEKRHILWVERDYQFLNQFSAKQLEKISSFMDLYNKYLEQKIQELSKDNKEV